MTANFRSLNPHKANTVLVPTFSTRKEVYYNAWTKQFQNWLLFVCLFVQKLLAWTDSRTYSFTIRRMEMTYGLFRQSMQIRPKHFYGYVYYFYCYAFYFHCYVYVFLLLCMFCSVYSVFIVPIGILRPPRLRFIRAFSSVVRQMPVYNSQRRGTARTLPIRR